MNSAEGVENIAVIDVLGNIGLDWWTGDGFTKEDIMNTIQGKTLKEIHFNLSSYGGDYAEALAIKNMAVMTGAKIKAHYFGLNASAVTEIANAATKEDTTIAADGYVLVHNTSTWAEGNKEQILKTIATLETFDDGLARNYAQKSGVKTAEDFKAQMQLEQWMNADTVVEWGLASKTTPAQPVSAEVKTGIKKAITNKSLTLPSDYVLEETNNDNMEITAKEFKEAFAGINNTFQTVLNAINNLGKPTVKNEMKKTKDGKSVYYDGALAVGTKVYDDEAMATPCVDGEYIIDDNTYTVANGEVTMVTPYVDPATANAEIETLKAQVEEEKAKASELAAQIENLKAENDKVKNEAKAVVEKLNTEFTNLKSTFFTGEELKPEFANNFKDDTQNNNAPATGETPLQIAARKRREEAAAKISN